MYCTRCGAQVPEGGKFCVVCGTLVEEAAPGSGRAVRPTPAAYQVPHPPPLPAMPAAQPLPAARKKTRRGRRILALVLLVFLLVLGTGVGVGYYIWSSPPAVDPANVETFILNPSE